MKQTYFFIAIFTLAITFKSHSQIVANFTGTNTGTLSGVPFTFTNTTAKSFSTSLSGAAFSAAPISGNTQIFEVKANDNWTVTFDTPLSNLRLYCRFLRTNVVEFDQPFAILSSDGTFLNTSGNQLETTTFSNGIIEFTNPITTLSLTYLSGDITPVAFTFGLPAALSIDNEAIINNKTFLYPNPANDIIKLSGLFKTENYSIFNILGTKVNKGIISVNDEIDIQNLPKGIYFLKLDNGNIFKFMKD